MPPRHNTPEPAYAAEVDEKIRLAAVIFDTYMERLLPRVQLARLRRQFLYDNWVAVSQRGREWGTPERARGELDEAQQHEQALEAELQELRRFTRATIERLEAERYGFRGSSSLRF
jgi:hypothetical protein